MIDAENPRPLQELISLQKRIFRENRAKIRTAESVPPPLYRQYEADYDRATATFGDSSTVGELLKAVRSADIVYVADFHTLRQAQNTFLKLLKRARVRPAERLVIGMEFVQGKFQKAIDAYLAGKLAERTFLQRIDYRNHWPYDVWAHYRPIFEYAREQGHRVMAIECNHDECNTLHGRDSYAGWRIAETLHADDKSKVVVLIGELHVAPTHLPAVVQANLEKIGLSKTAVTIYQNCEEIYWTLMERGEHDTEVVRIGDDAWCVLNTPPIVQQQSYLNVLDYDPEALEYGNLERNFDRLARAIARFLRIRITDQLDELQVYGPGDSGFLARLERKGVPKAELDECRRAVQAGESFYRGPDKLVYLARLGSNHAGAVATHLLMHVVSGWWDSRPLRESIYARVLAEALGFFGSKVMNHKRKCTHERAYHRVVARVHAGDLPEDDPGALVASLVVDHKRYERGTASPRFGSWFDQDDHTLRRTVRALGHMLGEKIYYALLRGKVARGEVRRLLESPRSRESEAAAAYFHWVARVGKTRIPKRL